MRRDTRRHWDKAGLATINPRECRHTYASLMIAAGVNAKALSTYMGHASINIDAVRLSEGREEVVVRASVVAHDRDGRSRVGDGRALGGGQPDPELLGSVRACGRRSPQR